MNLLILHPRAHRHRLCKRLVEHLAQEFSVTIVKSEYPGHTNQLVREIAESGGGLVFTAGGDGTLHEAVNGWAAAQFHGNMRFCPLPLGTGNDLLTSIDNRLQKIRTFLENPITREESGDLGLVTYETEGEVRQRYFCVGATSGFSAQVTQRREELANKLPGKASYLYALFESFFFWKNRYMRIESEEYPVESSTFFNLNAANVKFYGGGMISAPKADPFDGQLDVVSMNLTIWQALKALPENFRGNFGKVQNVEELRYQEPFTLQIEPPCPVQADGELLGQTPMSVECLVGGLPLLLPKLAT